MPEEMPAIKQNEYRTDMFFYMGQFMGVMAKRRDNPEYDVIPELDELSEKLNELYARSKESGL